MFFTKIFKFFLLTLSLSILWSCSNKGKEIEVGNICKIGSVLDLTGPLAMYGTWVKEGLQLAISDYNKMYPNNNLELVIEDSLSNVKAGVSAFQKLTEIDKIQCIIVAPDSSTVMANAPIANKNKVLLFTPASSSPSITNAGKFVMRNRISGHQEVEALVKFIISELKVKSAGIATLDNEAGHFYRESFIETFSKLGGFIPVDVTLGLGETDYRTQASKLKVANVSIVFIGSSVREAAYLIKNSFEIGFKPQWLSISPVANNILIDIAGQATEGIIVATEGITVKSDVFDIFNNKIKNNYGHEANFLNINSYDAIYILGEAIRSTSCNGEHATDYILNKKIFHGVAGTFYFDENGDVKKTLLINKLIKGQFVNIGQIDLR